MKKVKPYNTSKSKEEEIEQMFNNISHRYDLLNRLLSLGIDQSWRKKTLQCIPNPESSRLLDIATGTADIPIMAVRKFKVPKIVGFDLSHKMLEIGQQKINKYSLRDKISLQQGTVEKLPFSDASFDVITVGFGVRNFENLEQGLQEMYRVLQPGGQCIILEFSHPRQFPFKYIYSMYGKYVLPLLGSLTSNDQKAYSYLFESSRLFPAYEEFNRILKKNNFKKVHHKILTLGICCIYIGTK